MTESRSRVSVANAINLLYEICDSPGNFIEDDKWLAALATQTSYSEFSDEGRGITGCSLNTFKNVASNILIEGFSSINSTRRKAKQLLENLRAVKAKKRKSHRSYDLEIESLRLRISRYDGELQQMMVIIERLKYLARTLANHHQLEGRIDFWDVESQKINKMIQSIRGERYEK